MIPNATKGAAVNDQIDAILRIDVVSADDEETLRNDDYMTWRVANITSKDMIVRVKFKEPTMVSQGYKPDILVVYFDFSEL